jgi:hypothetical protein
LQAPESATGGAFRSVVANTLYTRYGKSVNREDRKKTVSAPQAGKNSRMKRLAELAVEKGAEAAVKATLSPRQRMRLSA